MDVTATNPSSNNFPGAESPGVEITIDAGAYSVDESGGPAGYNKTLGGDCTGNLAADASATCTITNTFVPDTGTLTLVKDVENDQGGMLVPSDFTLKAEGPDTIEGPSGISAAVQVGDYALSELIVPGYSFAGWDCPDATVVDGSVAIVVDADITCTVTNTDDAPVATITASMPDAAEPNINGEFEVVLSPAPMTGTTVIVTYDVLPESTATPGVDYVALSGSVVVDDTGMGFIDVVIIDDVEIESNETVVVQITSADVLVYTIGDPDTATVNIEDNDGGGVFSVYDLTIAELERMGYARVSRSGGAKGDASVDYDSADGTAFAPADYEAVSGTLYWNDGDASDKWIQLTVRNDNVDEGDEYFTVTLSNPQNTGNDQNPDGFKVEIDRAVATITITDPVPIPTLSAWAMILMAMILGMFGVTRIRTRQQRAL